MEDNVKLPIYVKRLRYFARVNQNLLVLFFELMVAKCFYLSGGLFSGFGSRGGGGTSL